MKLLQLLMRNILIDIKFEKTVTLVKKNDTIEKI